jgi:hypothetical protein
MELIDALTILATQNITRINNKNDIIISAAHDIVFSHARTILNSYVMSEEEKQQLHRLDNTESD